MWCVHLKQSISDAEVRAASEIIQVLLAQPYLSTTQLRQRVGINNRRFHRVLQDLLAKGLVERSENGPRFEHNLTGWLRVFLMEAISVQRGIERYIFYLLETGLESKDAPMFSLDVPIPGSLASMYILKQMRRFLAPFIHLSILESNLPLGLGQRKYLEAFFGDRFGRDVSNRTENLQMLEEVNFKMQVVQDIWTSLNSVFFSYFAKNMPAVHQRIKELEISKEKKEIDRARQLFTYEKRKSVSSKEISDSKKDLPTDLTMERKFSESVSLKKIIDYAKNYKSRKGAYIRIKKYKGDCLSWTFVMPGGTEEPTIFIKPEGLFLSKSINKSFSEKRILDQVRRVSDIITPLTAMDQEFRTHTRD